MNDNDALLTLGELANRLSLSKRWLKQEAEAARIPSLLAGRRRLFNEKAVREQLAIRAANVEEPRDE